MKNFTKSLWALLFVFLFNMESKAQLGCALAYDTDEFTTLPNGIVSGLTGDFTVEAWVYWRGGADWQRIFDFGTGDDFATEGYMYLSPQGAFGFGTIFGIKPPGNVEQQVSGGVIFPEDTWTHVAVTLDDAANEVRIFVNGTLAGLLGGVTVRPDDLGITNQNWLGRSQYPGDPFFEGVIDEFRISDIVRYPPGGFAPIPMAPFTLDGNTVALYHFEECAGQTAADESANSFDATLGADALVDIDDPSWINTATLPVSIITFAAQKADKAVVLKWQAAVTGNGGRFLIERSKDGRSFHPIGTIAIPANSGVSNYSFTDRSFTKDKNYYRLRIEEINSSPKYSSVVMVTIAAVKAYTAYPTITFGQIYVEIPSATTITIYNSNGVLIKKQLLSMSQNLNVQDFSSGVYNMHFEGSKETIRFVKM